VIIYCAMIPFPSFPFAISLYFAALLLQSQSVRVGGLLGAIAHLPNLVSEKIKMYNTHLHFVASALLC
jgi:hypothetical protein